MNSFFKKLKNINSNNLILYNHATRKLAKTKQKLKTKFNFFFKEISFELIYYLTSTDARFTLHFILLIMTYFQFKTILFYLYTYDHKIPYMTYYIADDLEKYDTDNIQIIELDELNLKKLKYAHDIKYY